MKSGHPVITVENPCYTTKRGYIVPPINLGDYLVELTALTRYHPTPVKLSDELFGNLGLLSVVGYYDVHAVEWRHFVMSQ